MVTRSYCQFLTGEVTKQFCMYLWSNHSSSAVDVVNSSEMDVAGISKKKKEVEIGGPER